MYLFKEYNFRTKNIMHYNSANMSFGQLCTQIQPIAFPEFPLHMQKYICV
jgi:hypothetical protein